MEFLFQRIGRNFAQRAQPISFAHTTSDHARVCMLCACDRMRKASETRDFTVDATARGLCMFIAYMTRTVTVIVKIKSKRKHPDDPPPPPKEEPREVAYVDTIALDTLGDMVRVRAIAAACLSIAAKVEEPRPPDLAAVCLPASDWTRSRIGADDFLAMASSEERAVFRVLVSTVSLPTPVSFLDVQAHAARVTFASGVIDASRTIVRLFYESIIHIIQTDLPKRDREDRALVWPQIIAASALHAAGVMCLGDDANELVRSVGYREDDVHALSASMQNAHAVASAAFSPPITQTVKHAASPPRKRMRPQAPDFTWDPRSYDVLHAIGDGSYGSVFHAVRTDTGAAVAVKRIQGDGESLSASAARELTTMFAFPPHEHVMSPVDAFFMADALCIVMPKIESDLRGYMARETPSEPAKRRILGSILCAIDHIHAHGVAHLDIKPENILVSRTGDVKLSDFGLARFRTRPMLNDHVTAQARQYRAPEAFYGHVSFPADIWSFGCIVAELENCAPPFQGECDSDHLESIRRVVGECTTCCCCVRSDPLAPCTPPCSQSDDAEDDPGSPRPGVFVQNEAARAVVRMMLQPCARARPTARDVMDCTYFAGVR